MSVKSKPLLGLKIGQRLLLSEREKRIIINDYLSGNETRRSVYKRYTGYEREHGKISKWMNELGMEAEVSKRLSNFTAVSKSKTDNIDLEFENLKLNKHIEQLEEKLKEAELKALAFSTMVDIAEQQFNIPIRKKFDTKSSKK